MMELLSSSSEKEAEADASREKVAISFEEEEMLLRLCGLVVGREEAMVVVTDDGDVWLLSTSVCRAS